MMIFYVKDSLIIIYKYKKVYQRFLTFRKLSDIKNIYTYFFEKRKSPESESRTFISV